MIWEEYRNTVQTCRSWVRNVKALLDLNPVGDMTGHKKVSAGTSVAKKNQGKCVPAAELCRVPGDEGCGKG